MYPFRAMAVVPGNSLRPQDYPVQRIPISTLCYGYAPFPVTAIRSTLIFVAAPSPRSPAPLSSNPRAAISPELLSREYYVASFSPRAKEVRPERRLQSRNAFVADENRTIETCSRGRLRCLLQNARFHRNGRAPGSRAESDSRS